MNKYFYFNSSVFVFMVSFNLAHTVVAFRFTWLIHSFFEWKSEKFKGKYVLSNSLGCMWLMIKIGKVTQAMAPHSSTLAWKIPWTEEPIRLQSMGLQRVGHDWATSLSLLSKLHCHIDSYQWGSFYKILGFRRKGWEDKFLQCNLGLAPKTSTRIYWSYLSWHLNNTNFFINGVGKESSTDCKML